MFCAPCIARLARRVESCDVQFWWRFRSYRLFDPDIVLQFAAYDRLPVDCAGKLLAWDWRGAPARRLWRWCLGELGAAWESLAQLFSPALRRTTVLLQLVWTADTFVYYGVVLLAATVCRPCQTLYRHPSAAWQLMQTHENVFTKGESKP